MLHCGAHPCHGCAAPPAGITRPGAGKQGVSTAGTRRGRWRWQAAAGWGQVQQAGQQAGVRAQPAKREMWCSPVDVLRGVAHAVDDVVVLEVPCHAFLQGSVVLGRGRRAATLHAAHQPHARLAVDLDAAHACRAGGEEAGWRRGRAARGGEQLEAGCGCLVHQVSAAEQECTALLPAASSMSSVPFHTPQRWPPRQSGAPSIHTQERAAHPPPQGRRACR